MTGSTRDSNAMITQRSPIGSSKKLFFDVTFVQAIEYCEFLDILFIACSICNAPSADAEFCRADRSHLFRFGRVAMSQNRFFFARSMAAVAMLALCGLANSQTKWDMPTAYPPSNYHTGNI